MNILVSNSKSLALLLVCSMALICPSFLHAQPQQRPSEKYRAEKEKRRTEDREKVIKEIVKFFTNEHEGKDQGMANRINEWYTGKEKKLVIGPFGPNDPGIAYYERSTGIITIDEKFIDNMVMPDGTVNFGDIVSVSQSLVHEFTHVDQSWLDYGRSATTNVQLTGTHMAEEDAYFAAWRATANWIDNQTSKLNAMPKGATACDKAPDAEKIQQFCGAFINYYGAMKAFDISKRPAAVSRLEKLKKEISEKEKELASLRQQQSEMEGGSGIAIFDTITQTLNKSKLAEIKKQAEAKEREITPLQKDANDIEEIKWLNLNRHTWIVNGKQLTNDQAMTGTAQLRSQMFAIIAECEKEKKQQQKSPSATPPKDPDKKDQSAAPKEKTDIFGDLCTCSCAGVSSYYDHARGCVCLGPLWGQEIVPMVSSGKCFDNWTAGVDPARLREQIRKMNADWSSNYIRMVNPLIEDYWTPQPGLSQGKRGPKGATESTQERMKRKSDAGDIEQASAYASAAASFSPDHAGEANAVITGFPWRAGGLAYSVIPELAFDAAISLLEHTLQLDPKKHPNLSLEDTGKRLRQVKKWQGEWAEIKRLSEQCFSMIDNLRPCECQRLFDGKIEPLNKSFNIPTGRTVEGATFERSPDELRLGAPRFGTLSEMEQTPIPEKDALRGKLGLALENSRRACRYQPGLAEPVGVLEAYIADRARPGRTDQTIADTAKRVLEREALCDCERELAEKALGIADKWMAEQGPPLKVTLQATKTVMKKGESVELTPTISGGSPPYNFSYIGYRAFDVTGGAITGQGQTTTSLRAKIVGAHPLDISVTDAKGKKTSGKIVLNVIEDTPEKTITSGSEQGGIQPPLQGGVDGIWEGSFNNYRGKMELNRAGNTWTGRIWFDVYQRWEQLTNISFQSATGRLEFTRPISGATQRYSGTLSAERLEGTFTQENTSTKYHWWAKRTQLNVIEDTTEKTRTSDSGQGASSFDKPTYKGYRLDICRVWAGDCGKGAADAFCRTKGFASAESWEVDHDIGHISPTIVISSERICNQRLCDGFKFIKCAK